MDKVYVQFLQIIKCSLYNKNITFEEDDNINWDKILNLARIYKVLPMVYKTACNDEEFKKLDLKKRNILEFSTKEIILWQNYRSEKFLQIYKEFLKENIKVIVFKGIILRNLYETLDDIICSDENILIKEEDFIKCEEILLKNNFQKIVPKNKAQDIVHYICEKTILHIAVYTKATCKEYKEFQIINNIFNDSFENNIKIKINNNEIYTFSLNNHFLYIILEKIKDFMNWKMEIREFCNLTIYINTYYSEIDWEYIWKTINFMGYETLFVNILEICIKYLGLNEKYIKYTKNKDEYYINVEELLGDMVNEEISAQNKVDKLNEESMLLYENNKYYYINLISSKKQYLKNKYKYLNKYPYLLPLLLIKEILTDKKDVKKSDMRENKKSDLLKKYKTMN